MTTVPKGHPGGRTRRIQIVAMIVLGRDPQDKNRPAPGWMAKLSRAMGLSHSVVSSTMNRASDPSFDRRLRYFAQQHRLQMIEDEKALLEIEQIIDHTTTDHFRTYADKGIDE